ncbi:putative Tic20 family protein [Breznakia sp. PF5-3]|uniref:hypothetical protein n=1 Tax=unclassified Breznakia TaxID=2623764 RepID=UPI0024049D47|nr:MULTISPECIES: hypothetical protein [unclassified Breznakia]MDF9825454.1 putative Tic20 family protein [Breznakia sp. PM6-1]MDF9836468.1 putative Tic20 family protein [Breznakia sp. PF5-3]MDF9838496.1 putative Tic20 family protein [Breznakia sp. PFB2-8]MDF9860618.1 putative Tic20 family protein [Breznakia sp. PH5-24]
MDSKKILLFGKVINVLLVVTSLLVFAFWSIWGGDSYYMTYETYRMLETSITVYRVVAILLLAASAFLFVKGRKQVSGLEFLVAASGAMVIMSMMKIVLGILIWILAGIAMRKMTESNVESDFSSKLEGN